MLGLEIWGPIVWETNFSKALQSRKAQRILVLLRNTQWKLRNLAALTYTKEPSPTKLSLLPGKKKATAPPRPHLKP